MIHRIAGRAANAARQAATLFLDSGLILLYHRVAEMRPDPWSLAVTPEHFAEHLEILRRYCVPLSVEQLAAALVAGAMPHRAVVITFDDGYADNLHGAKPLLERHGVPATVFLSTGTLGSGREFWWDELEKVLLQPGTRPGVLQLEIRGRSYSWNLGDAARYSEAAAWSHRSWIAWQKPPSQRHRIYLTLRDLLQPLDLTEQREVMDQLLDWAGIEASSRPTYRILTQEEVTELVAGGLIEIGAHTVTHPALSRVPIAVQGSEIRQSKAGLEEILGRPVRSFAYPFGGREDYTRASVRLVQEAGFACACSSLGGAVTRYADRYQLPRLYMRDMDGDEFARTLSRHLRVRIS